MVDREKPGRTIRCPRCRTPIRWGGNPFRPFCSERCKMIDLGAWADEAYRLAESDPIASDRTPSVDEHPSSGPDHA